MLVGLAVAAMLALVVASCGPSAPGAPGGGGVAGGATVTRVVDGDTIVVRIGGRQERVRLIGIDTPESVKPGTPVQCFAHEASERARSLMPAGTPVKLVGDVERRDHYGRLLAYVYRQRDDLFVNQALVQEGFAVPYTIAPNVAHTDELLATAVAARRAGAGLWSRCGSSIPVHDGSQLPSPP